MKHVKMHGPSISDPSKTVERDVPEGDVQAYRSAGYVEGPLPKKTKEADILEVPADEPKTDKKGKK